MRPPGWESLLAAHLAAARTRPFAWGDHDCVLWSAEWVATLSGTDPAADWRGKYATAEEAASVLAAMGFTSWADLAAPHLPAIPVARARRGDIMAHPVNGGLGICDGIHAYFVTERGLTRVEYTKCPRAWAVG